MSHLTSHQHVHTQEKLFTSELWNKSLSHQSDLTRHRRIHLVKSYFHVKSALENSKINNLKLYISQFTQ